VLDDPLGLVVERGPGLVDDVVAERPAATPLSSMVAFGFALGVELGFHLVEGGAFRGEEVVGGFGDYQLFNPNLGPIFLPSPFVSFAPGGCGTGRGERRSGELGVFGEWAGERGSVRARAGDRRQSMPQPIAPLTLAFAAPPTQPPVRGISTVMGSPR